MTKFCNFLHRHSPLSFKMLGAGIMGALIGLVLWPILYLAGVPFPLNIAGIAIGGLGVIGWFAYEFVYLVTVLAACAWETE